MTAGDGTEPTQRSAPWWLERRDDGHRPAAARGPGSRRGFGRTWWGRAWVDALEHRAELDPGRLARGRSYARRGAVIRMDVAPGLVMASVQGSRPTPYTVTVVVPTFDASGWTAVLEAIGAQIGRTAALLDGELPPEVVDDVASAGLDLLPGAGEVRPSCSCPDQVRALQACRGGLFPDRRPAGRRSVRAAVAAWAPARRRAGRTPVAAYVRQLCRRSGAGILNPAWRREPDRPGPPGPVQRRGTAGRPGAAPSAGATWPAGRPGIRSAIRVGARPGGAADGGHPRRRAGLAARHRRGGRTRRCRGPGAGGRFRRFGPVGADACLPRTTPPAAPTGYPRKLLRRISKHSTAAALATFKDSTFPAIGMLTHSLTYAPTSGLTPPLSLPNTNAAYGGTSMS